jgi:hypothetical protein
MGIDTAAALEEILEGLEDGDGICILVVKSNRQVTLHIPQLGLMSEATVEQQIPQIYQLISRRRGEIRLEQENERSKNRTKTEQLSSGGGRPRARVGQSPA